MSQMEKNPQITRGALDQTNHIQTTETAHSSPEEERVTAGRISTFRDSLTRAVSDDIAFANENTNTSQELREEIETTLRTFILRGTEPEIAEEVFGSELVKSADRKIQSMVPSLNLSRESMQEDVASEMERVRNELGPELHEIFNSNRDDLYSGRYRATMERKGVLLGIFDYELKKPDVVFPLSSGEVVANSLVLELHISDLMLPSKGEIAPSMNRVADFLSEHPEIQAVVGFSWIFSHPLAKRLGFEIPDLETTSYLKYPSALQARTAKPGFTKLEKYPYRWGGIGRDDFLRRYATQKEILHKITSK